MAMIRILCFTARFTDIGLMPIKIYTYKLDAKAAIATYIERMKGIGVEVLETSDAHFVSDQQNTLI